MSLFGGSRGNALVAGMVLVGILGTTAIALQSATPVEDVQVQTASVSAAAESQVASPTDTGESKIRKCDPGFSYHVTLDSKKDTRVECNPSGEWCPNMEGADALKGCSNADSLKGKLPPKPTDPKKVEERTQACKKLVPDQAFCKGSVGGQKSGCVWTKCTPGGKDVAASAKEQTAQHFAGKVREAKTPEEASSLKKEGVGVVGHEALNKALTGEQSLVDEQLAANNDSRKEAEKQRELALKNLASCNDPTNCVPAEDSVRAANERVAAEEKRRDELNAQKARLAADAQALKPDAGPIKPGEGRCPKEPCVNVPLPPARPGTPGQTPPGGQQTTFPPGGGQQGPGGGGNNGGGGLGDLLKALTGQGQQKQNSGSGGGGGGGMGQQCQTGYVCQGNSLFFRQYTCQQNFVQSCQHGCQQQSTMTNVVNFFAGSGSESTSCAPNPQTGTGGTGTAPSGEISCSPKVADVGMKIAISYSCSNSVKATGSGWTATSLVSGSAEAIVEKPPAGANTVSYGLTCTSLNGQTANATPCSIEITKPLIMFVATPKVVNKGETSNLGWVTKGIDYCIVSSPTLAAFTSENASKKNANGTVKTPALQAAADFKLTCTTKAGQTKEATLSVSVTN